MTPKTTKPRPRPLTAALPVGRCLALAWLALGAAAAPTTAREAERVLVAPPVMVTTGEAEPTWETIPELKAAAVTGDPLACFQYAQLLEAGDQVPQNSSEAFKFYQRAAFSDHADSLFRVAKAYHEGQLNQPENHELAYEYYQRAAYLDHAEATHNVGAMLVSGRGVKRNYREGLAWLMLAAERGIDPGSVDQVKHRLRSRPEWITDAENRLGGLKTEIAMGPLETEPSLAPAVTKPAAPVVKPTAPSLKPSIGAPALPGLAPSISTPAIAPPTIAIPQPKPKPVEPESAEAE